MVSCLSHIGLGLRPANERRRYLVTTSLFGWVQVWNQPWTHIFIRQQCHLWLTNGLSSMCHLAVTWIVYDLRSISTNRIQFDWRMMLLLFLKKVLLKLASAMSLPCRSRERLDNSLCHTSEKWSLYYTVLEMNITPIIISRQLLFTFRLPWHMRFQQMIWPTHFVYQFQQKHCCWYILSIMVYVLNQWRTETILLRNASERSERNSPTSQSFTCVVRYSALLESVSTKLFIWICTS